MKIAVAWKTSCIQCKNKKKPLYRER